MGAVYDCVLNLQQEGPSVTLSGLFECCDHVKFESYLAIIFSTHLFNYRPFSLLVVSACLLHGVHTSNSCRGFPRDSYSPSEIFSDYQSPHPLEGVL